MMYRVIVCDDDREIRQAIKIYLGQENYEVLEAENGREAIELVREKEIHLVLMDIMMPIMDGIQAAVDIRKESHVPIIFLSAKSEDTDRILGLTIGADDYVTKPFNPIELLARVKAHIRRYTTFQSPTQASDSIFVTGDLVLDDEKKEVQRSGEIIQLTAVEYNILRLLMGRLNQVFSANQIYELVWNEPAYDVGRIISVHVRHIREKIEFNSKEPRYLKVVYGLGYKVVKINE